MNFALVGPDFESVLFQCGEKWCTPLGFFCKKWLCRHLLNPIFIVQRNENKQKSNLNNMRVFNIEVSPIKESKGGVKKTRKSSLQLAHTFHNC